MILAVDVQYRATDATVAGVLFAQWDDPQAAARHTLICEDIAEYVPASFIGASCRASIVCSMRWTASNPSAWSSMATSTWAKSNGPDWVRICGSRWIGAYR